MKFFKSRKLIQTIRKAGQLKMHITPEARTPNQALCV